MEILYARCAGLDIHRDTIVASVRLAEAGGVVRFVETFATTTTELERLSDWLSGHKVTHVAMEATGCTGSRSGPSWRRTLSWYWPMRCT